MGWLNSARWLPYLILGLVVGALVDRTHRRPVMVATNVTRAVLLALIPLAWVLDLLTFPLLLVVVSNDPATMRSRRLRESALWGNLAHTRHSEVR